MNATIKYLTFIDDDYQEDSKGAIPCLEWNESSGDTRRSFVFKCSFNLSKRVYKISVITQIQTKSGNWRDDNTILVFEPETSDDLYVDMNTGIINYFPFEDDLTKPIIKDGKTEGYEQKVKVGLQSESQFFIDNFGKNIHNKTLNLYEFFLIAIARKLNLTII